MTNEQHSSDDQALWEIAKLRSSFKQNLAVYFLVNSFLVLVWLFTAGWKGLGYFWPIWPILGWGVGVALHYLRAYQTINLLSTEAEFRKLKDGQK